MVLRAIESIAAAIPWKAKINTLVRMYDPIEKKIAQNYWHVPTTTTKYDRRRSDRSSSAKLVEVSSQK